MHFLFVGGESRRGLIAIVAHSAHLINLCMLFLNMFFFFLSGREDQGRTVVASEPSLCRATIFLHDITQFYDCFVSAVRTQTLVVFNITLSCESPNFSRVAVQHLRIAGLLICEVDAGGAQVDPIV